MTRNQKIELARHTMWAAVYLAVASVTLAYAEGWWQHLLGVLAGLAGFGRVDRMWDTLKAPDPEAVHLIKARTVPQQRGSGR